MWKDLTVLLTVCALSIIVVGYGWLALRRDCFGFDEADYMWAASRGVWANYSDTPSLTLSDFAIKGRVGTHGNRARLSEYVRASGDIPFYRHYHGPVSTYVLIAWTHMVGTSEALVRLETILCHLLTSVLIGCCARCLAGNGVAGLFGFGVSLTSPILLESASTLNPHTLYSLFVVGALTCTAMAIRDRKVQWLYGASVSVALAAATVEFALFLAFAVSASLVLADSGFGRRQYFGSALPLLGTVLVVWPAGLLKLTLVKNYTFFAYYSIFLRSTYGNDSLLLFWWKQFVSSPFEWVFLVTGLVVLCWRSGRPLWILPFVIYATLLAATTLVNRGGGAYVSSLLVCLAVPAAAGWASLRTNLLSGLLISAMAVNFVCCFDPLPVQPHVTVAVMAARLGRTTAVPRQYVPSVHYYQMR